MTTQVKDKTFKGSSKCHGLMVTITFGFQSALEASGNKILKSDVETEKNNGRIPLLKTWNLGQIASSIQKSL